MTVHVTVLVSYVVLGDCACDSAGELVLGDCAFVLVAAALPVLSGCH